MKTFIQTLWIALIAAAVLFMPQMAYAAEIQMGVDGMLVFEPCELTVDVGEKVTFINNELPPHNVMFADYQELSHGDLMFSAGEVLMLPLRRQVIIISSVILMLVLV